MITVILSFPNNQRREVLLAGVPRVGESIRLANGISEPSLTVEHILWSEATLNETEPTVVVAVRPAPPHP